MKFRCLLLVAALVGCREDIAAQVAPQGCGNGCATNSDCSDFFNSCRVCFNGRCARSLPAAPVIDAGIPDATRASAREKD